MTPPFAHQSAFRCFVFLTALLLVSCDSRRQDALNLVAGRGIIASEDVLFEALDEQDSALVIALVDLDIPADARDGFRRTPMMIAAGEGDTGLIQALCERGADANAVDATGRTPVAYAVESEKAEAVAAILKCGADPAVKVDTGGTLVVQALRNGQSKTVRLLLDAGASPRSEGPLGETLTEVAVGAGDTEIMAHLIKMGVDLKDEAQGGGELVHEALASEREEMVELLLREGADSTILNKDGEGLGHAAVNRGLKQFFSIFKKHGVSLDALDSEGWRPLHHAVLVRDIESLQVLLDQGANPDLLSGGEGEPASALRIAFENRLFPIAALLLRYGADPGDELYRAAERGGVDGRHATELLLDAGASPVPSRSPRMDSPFHVAVRRGEWEIAKLLLDGGASVNSRGPSGQIPLHVAVARGDARLVGLLLDMGADPNQALPQQPSEQFLDLIKTKGIAKWALRYAKALTPLMLASDTGNVEVAQQLISHGADTKKSTIVRRSRMWPLTFATRRSDVPMMQTILGREPGKSGKWARVDLSQQRAYVYDGEKQIYSSRVSTGKRGYRTRQGKFVVTNKYRHWKSTIYGSSMPYFQRLSASDFGFHVGHLPGYAASHGCIRMPWSGAKKFFSLLSVGDYVEIQP